MHGILLVNKPRGKTSFALVAVLRKLLNVKKIGHAGTLDPFATGVMVMLVGREATRLSNQYLCDNKAYTARLLLGIATDSYDCEGQVTLRSDLCPTLQEVEQALSYFQGAILQVPPMFSAKKVGGKKLYELARKGKTIERQPVEVNVKSTLIHYEYPYLTFSVFCSKGTYIRSIAHEIGERLGCGGHLVELHRIQSGEFSIEHCIDGAALFTAEANADVIKKALLPEKVTPFLNNSDFV